MDSHDIPCPICQSKSLNSHSEGRVYCKACKKRYSYQKIVTEARIIEYFALSIPARQVSLILNKNYKTIHRVYHRLRQIASDQTFTYLQTALGVDRQRQKSLFARALEEQAGKNRKTIPMSIAQNVDKIFFLIQDHFGPKMLPGAASETKTIFDANISLEYGYREFSFLKSLAPRFWRLFRKQMSVSRGSGRKNLLLYLKASEFMYNSRGQNPQKLLKSLWFFTR